jgi:uncharacterized protein
MVLVRELPTKRHFNVPSEFVAAALRGLPMREALGSSDAEAGDGGADLELYADGSHGTHVFAVGHIKGHAKVACSRCVGTVDIQLDEALRVTFMPRSEIPEAVDADEEDGEEIAEGDIDVFAYDGEIIDLEPLLREQFVLAVPYAPLCREDCKGLCPQCGIDRNAGSCTCEEPIDPRFAGLRGLKLPS